MLSVEKVPLADDVECEERGHQDVGEQQDAPKVKVVDLSKWTCACPDFPVGSTGDVLNTIDEDLGHSLAFGGGYGHNMEIHWRSLRPLPFFDTCVRFEDDTHTYYYRCVPPYFKRERRINSSTTAVIKDYFGVFDADAVIAGMRKRGRMTNPNDAYYGMSDEEIKKNWEDNGADKSGIGSDMHAAIERFLNNARVPNDPDEEKLQFVLFRAWHLDTMVGPGELPFRTELCMIDEEHEMAGMCDLVSQPLAWRSDPVRRWHVNLKDWKCTDKCNWEALPFTSEAQRSVRDPRRCFVDRSGTRQYRYDKATKKTFAAKPALMFCGELLDCEASKYFIQLNVYKWMLERNSPYTVETMQIVAFHWTNTEPVVIDVPNLQHVVEKMMARRARDMKRRYESQIAEFESEMEVVRSRLESLMNPTTRKFPRTGYE